MGEKKVPKPKQRAIQETSISYVPSPHIRMGIRQERVPYLLQGEHVGVIMEGVQDNFWRKRWMSKKALVRDVKINRREGHRDDS